MLTLEHKKLSVWKLSVEFVVNIYSATEKYPVTEQYGLVTQLRRAAVSIPSNISEGASRASSKERKRFFEIARSSLVEMDAQLEVSRKLNFISPEDLEQISIQMNKLFAMLTKLKANTK